MTGPSSRHRFVWVIAASVCAALCAGLEPSAAATPPLPRWVPTDRRFDLSLPGVDLADALRSLQAESALLFCYEDYLERPEQESTTNLGFGLPVTIDLKSVTVFEALDALVEATGTFVWRREGRIVTIMHPKCMRVTDYPLDEVVQVASFRGTWLDLRLGPLSELSPRIRSSAGYFLYHDWEMRKPRTVVAVEMHNVSLRRFLNAVSSACSVSMHYTYRSWDGTIGLWVTPVFTYCPSLNLKHLPDGSLTITPNLHVERARTGAVVESGDVPQRGHRRSWAVPVSIALGLVCGFALGVLVARRSRRRADRVSSKGGRGTGGHPHSPSVP